jgi:S-DNA-T family DNA segregation ATPase FtsK/SpoIIIE
MARQAFKINRVDKNTIKNILLAYLIKRITEGSLILIGSCVLFIMLALITYHDSDPGWSHAAGHYSHVALPVLNAGGRVGAYIADALYFLLGYFCYWLPIGGTYFAFLASKNYQALRQPDNLVLSLRGIGFLLFILAGCSLLSLLPGIKAINGSQSAGGLLGDVIARHFMHALNLQGAMLALMAILLVGITWLTGISWIKITESIGYHTLWLLNQLQSMIVYCANRCIVSINRLKNRPRSVLATPSPRITDKPCNKERKTGLFPSIDNIITPLKKRLSHHQITRKESFVDESLAVVTLKPESTHTSTPKLGLELAPVSMSIQASIAPRKESLLPVKKTSTNGLPALTLLEKAKPGKPLGGYTPEELERVAREVEQHLIDFGIHADVVAVRPGPVITRFELQLAAGIKVGKLTALSKDLARSLSVISVRIVEVIPGKTVVGLELPNQHRETVSLSEVLSAEVYQQAHSPLTLALGVDISGYPMIVDLAKMPHLLVAGTTGSDKSVGINAMILSILFKATPEQVRLIMIDPKMLELSVYDGIPHLLTPVVTDMKKAATALRWCVAEMEKRYRLMSSLGVGNIAGYNSKVSDAIAVNQPLVDPLWKVGTSMDETAPLLQLFPYIVVVINELADMMMVVGKKVEQLIARIAQKAKAAGIHLILATQRPSVDVFLYHS